MASIDSAENIRGKQTAANPHNSLALFIAQSQNARRGACQYPSTGKNDEDDRVFLCGCASENSFVGHLDDEDSITDRGIEEFIRQNNPDMFRRLFEAEGRSAKSRLQDSGTSYHTSGPEAKLDVTTASYDQDIYSSFPQYYDMQQVLFQLRRLLISSLLGGHVLVLQKVTDSLPISCGHPRCLFRDNPVLRGIFTLELRLEGVQQVRHFCLRCLESVFSCQAASSQRPQCLSMTQIAQMAELDGMTEVLIAAQKLAAPSLKGNGAFKTIRSPAPTSRKTLRLRGSGNANTKDHFEPDFPFDHPSNSAQALSLRRKRNAEIEEILNDVKKHDDQRKDDGTQPQKSPLIITPPPRMPGEERYKKQGLSKWDKEKERVISRRDTTSGSSSTSISSTKSMLERICQCLEPAGVGVLLKCEAEYCPVGTYHLQCTGLLQRPAANLVWYCSKCSGIPEGFLTAASVESLEGQEELSMKDADFDSENDELLGYDGDISLEDQADSDQLSLITARSIQSPESHSRNGSIGSVIADIRGVPSDVSITSVRSIEAISALKSIDPDEAPSSPSRTIAPVNSFTPINPTCTPLGIRHSPLFSLDGSPLVAKEQAIAYLPMCWSEITFEDLSPFILAETNVASLRALAPEHVSMLVEWRAACPISRLLPSHRVLSSFHANNVQAVSLSHLLAMVESEMAER